MTFRVPLISKRSTFEQHWERFGPESSTENVLTVDLASRYCRELANSHYENFSIASWLIPSSLRKHFFHIYAYCRWSDDLADESSDTQQAMDRLDWWQSELDRCFAGTASHPVFIALRTTLDQYQLDQQPFHDLLSAFRQDQRVTRYDTDTALQDYCRRSANPVGRILLQLAHVRSEQCYEWSDSICTALQLANFAQDIARDAVINRIYLPRTRWDKYSIDEAMILANRACPALCKTVSDWSEDIRQGFYNGWKLTNHVPRWLSRDVTLFAGGGLAILDAIQEKSGDVWSQRIEVSKAKKMKLFLRSLVTRNAPKSLPLRHGSKP